MTDTLRKLPDRQSYRPSNGTEGVYFDEKWCAHCKADKAYRDSGYEDHGTGCDILARSLANRIDDPGYPVEWVYQKGEPVCTAFDDEALTITNQERAAQVELPLSNA